MKCNEASLIQCAPITVWPLNFSTNRRSAFIDLLVERRGQGLLSQWGQRISLCSANPDRGSVAHVTLRPIGWRGREKMVRVGQVLQTTDQGPWHEPAHQGLILVRGGSDIWLVLIFIINLLLSTKMVRIKILSSQVLLCHSNQDKGNFKSKLCVLLLLLKIGPEKSEVLTFYAACRAWSPDSFLTLDTRPQLGGCHRSHHRGSGDCHRSASSF